MIINIKHDTAKQAFVLCTRVLCIRLCMFYVSLKIKAHASLTVSTDARNMGRSGRKPRDFLCCFRLGDLVFR